MIVEAGMLGLYGAVPVYESRRLAPLAMVRVPDVAGVHPAWLLVGEVRYLKVRLELSAYIAARVAETRARLGLDG